MSPRTWNFLVFGLFGAASLVAGYVARRRRWLDEELSRPIHFHTVVWVWSVPALLSLWRIPPRPENFWLLIVQPALMALAGYSIIPLAKAMHCPHKQVGVLAVAGGTSNTGFTLGAYLCYSLLQPPETALAYGMAYVITAGSAAVLLLYPVARHYGKAEGQTSTVSLRQFVMETFFDLRAMPLYSALAGLALAITETPFPAVIDRWRIIDVFFYLGSFGGYFAIGLRLRLGDTWTYTRQHALLAAVKFVATPLAAAAMLRLIGLTLWPLDPVANDVIQVQSFMPAAIVSVMLANLFDLDARMASVTWVVNTVLFLLIPLPLILWWWSSR